MSKMSHREANELRKRLVAILNTQAEGLKTELLEGCIDALDALIREYVRQPDAYIVHATYEQNASREVSVFTGLEALDDALEEAADHKVAEAVSVTLYKATRLPVQYSTKVTAFVAEDP